MWTLPNNYGDLTVFSGFISSENIVSADQKNFIKKFRIYTEVIFGIDFCPKHANGLILSAGFPKKNTDKLNQPAGRMCVPQ